MNETYKNTGKGLSRYDLQRQLPSWKKEYQFFKYYSEQLMKEN